MFGFPTEYIIIWVVVGAVLGAMVGERNGHGAGMGIIVGALLGLFGVAFLALTKGSQPTPAQREQQRHWEQQQQYDAWRATQPSNPLDGPPPDPPR